MEDNQQIIERIKKLFATAEGGENESASSEIKNEAFVAMKLARKLLAKHQLDEDVIRQKAIESNQVYVPPSYGKSTIANPHRRANARGSNKRRVWFEKLAEVVAEGNFCKIGLIPQNGEVSFYGFDMDREICIFTFLKLADIAEKLCKIELKKCKAAVGAVNFKTGETNPEKWCGDDSFIESFHQGFRELIKEIYDEMFSEENNETSNIGVEKFCKENYEWRNYENPEIVRRNDRLDNDEISIEEFYVKVGRKIGEKAASKLSLDEGKCAVANLIQVAQKKNQARTEKERRLLEEKLGIDPNLPEEIIFALDDSGSMGYSSKIEQVKSASTSGAQNLTQLGKKVGLVTFGSNKDRLIKPDNPLHEDFYEVISKLVGRNSTPMHNAIRQATNYFKTIKSRRTLIIVTDGQPDSKESALEEAEKAKEIGTVIQVIGTDDAPKDFMDKLSSNGKSMQVTNAQLGAGVSNMVKMLCA